MSDYFTYYQNNKLKTHSYKITHNLCCKKEWFDNGISKTIQFYLNDLPHGDWYSWYKNGEIEYKKI